MVTTPQAVKQKYNRETDENETVACEDTLELLGDEYTKAILDQLTGEALCANEVARRSDMSRCTIYRRLNKLEENGVVETSQQVNVNGNHRKEFKIDPTKLTIVIDESGIELKITN